MALRFMANRTGSDLQDAVGVAVELNELIVKEYEHFNGEETLKTGEILLKAIDRRGGLTCLMSPEEARKLARILLEITTISCHWCERDISDDEPLSNAFSDGLCERCFYENPSDDTPGFKDV